MDPQPDSRLRRWTTVVLGAITVVLGVVFALGGFELIWLGGSPYYLCAGAGLIACGSSYLRCRRSRLYIYALVLVVTVCWAWFESSNGWWLMARVLAPCLFGILLTLPGLGAGAARVRGVSGGTLRPHFVIAVTLLLIVLMAVNRPMLAPPSTDVAPDYLQAGGIGLPDSGATPGALAVPQDYGGADWLHYAGGLGGNGYSTLTQISSANVGKLRRVWTYHTGNPVPAVSSPGTEPYSFSSTPLEARGKVYVCTSRAQLIAIDAETGKEAWRFNPPVDVSKISLPQCRGVSFYAVPDATGVCANRILFGTIYARLLAFDADTGEKCPGFGSAGVVDLTEGMGSNVPAPFSKTPVLYYPTSPPTIAAGKAIVGQLVWDNVSRNSPSGVVRAYDAVSGKLVWAWDMARPERTGLPPPGDSYTRDTPNVWAPISADERLGLAYLPVANQNPDFFSGGKLPVTETYGSSIVALDLESGRERWHFQIVHHDMWDYDVNSMPALIDFPVGDHTLPAVVVTNKLGELFVLDRRDGTPLVQTVEQPVPQGAVPGDWTAPTQPVPIGMPLLGPPAVTEASMWGLTPLDQLWCRIRFRRARYEGRFTPQSLQGTILNPGSFGVIPANGVNIDPVHQVLIANTSWMPFLNTLLRREDVAASSVDPAHYMGLTPMGGTPYLADVQPFTSLLRVPCTAPPWGHLTAIDLKTRRILWRTVLGDSRDDGPLSTRIGLPLPTGGFQLGGAVTTRGGLVFVGATTDALLRAYDARTGKLLWQDRLPGAATASPSTFMSRSGRQLVVVAAGGHSALSTRLSDAVVAYALAGK